MELLSTILEESPAGLSNEEQILWFSRLLKWLQRPRSADEKEQQWETIYSLRLKFLLQQVLKNAEWQQNFISLLDLSLMQLSQPFQLAMIGMPTEASFVQSFMTRVQEIFLPQTPLKNDMGTLIQDVFPDEHESLLIDAIDEDILVQFMKIMASDQLAEPALKKNLLESLRILSIQMLEGALSIRIRLDIVDTNRFTFPEFELEEYVFHQLIRKSSKDMAPLWKLIADIQTMTDLLFEQLIKAGVKINIVYSFQIHRKRLKRFQMILSILDPDKSTASSLRLLASQLVLDVHEQRGFVSFLRANLSLLAERVVQANSHVGEHYVARSWKDFNTMLTSAMGGGVITAATVYIKYGFAKLGFVGFLKGFFDGLNYSASFLTIQLLGFTLATKQPSTTAPFILRHIQHSLREGGQTILALLRTQFIAVFGNLASVFPICFLTAFALHWLKYDFFSYEEAHHVFESSNLFGPSILFATITGVLLFSASLIAGWFENFCVNTQLPIRIQYNKRFNKWLGIKNSKRLADFFSENSNALAANVSLGFIMGLAPQVIAFFGIPIEVRHVTLATGGFAASLPVMLEQGISWYQLANAASGILAIGIINISVSFLCAFILASLSSGVGATTMLKLFKWSALKILRKPWILLIPEEKKNRDPVL